MPKRLQSLADEKRFHQCGRAHFGRTGVRSLRFEPLEGRCLLSATPADAALQVFNAAPALFVENHGQWQDDAVYYRFGGPGLDISFTDEGLNYLLMEREAATDNGAVSEDMLTANSGRDLEPEPITRATQFSVSFGGANTVTPVGLDEAITKFNYFVGDQLNWREAVSSFATVAYENLYNGIDLHTFGSRDSLKYEFHVAPGADWRQIQVNYDGIEGLSIDDAGALHIRTELGELIDTAPYIYQQINGQQVEVAGSFILLDNDTYAFNVQGAYDPTAALVIDPYVLWSTYLGGPPSDYGNDIATNASGEVLVTGYATATDTWVSGGYDTSFGGGYDAYVVKLSATGQHLWSTYLGGTGQDIGNAIAVNSSGEVLVTGQMYSTGWASGGFDTSNGGESDAFVVKLSATGQHVWSTYMGGTAIDYGSGIAVDSAGSVLITGQSALSGTWVVGGADTSFNGGLYDAFAAKLTSTGQRSWITYIGGDDDDHGQNIAVLSTGVAYVSGYTDSAGWTSGGYDTILDGGEDAFVVKLALSNGATTWSTYLGGSGNDDNAYGIAVDASGNAYVTGYTDSNDWVSGGFDTSFNGNPYDAFVAKLASDGSHTWSTYVGGSADDRGEGIALNSNGDIFATGFTNSSGWVSGGFDTSYNGGTDDAYVVKLNSSGSHLWSSYLGGSTYDVGNEIATIGSSAIVVIGNTNSANWVSGGFDASFGGNYDPFVARIVDATVSPPTLLGDYNRNNTVDAADNALWRNTLGMFNIAPYSGADGNGDGRIGQEDYDVSRLHFGESFPAAGAAAGSGDDGGYLAPAEAAATGDFTIPSTTLPVTAFGLPFGATVSQQVGPAVRESHRLVGDTSANDAALLAWFSGIDDEHRTSDEANAAPGDVDASAADELIADEFGLYSGALFENGWGIA